MTTLTTFTYRGELYIRVIPAKSLFRSTLIHEVVNRRDVFAIRVSDSTLTIIPQNAAVTHSSHFLMPTAAEIAREIKGEAAPLSDIPNVTKPRRQLSTKDQLSLELGHTKQ